MKERPILFSGPMVRAVLAGTKTQTRRILKLSTRMVARHARLDIAWPDRGLGAGGYLKVPYGDDGSYGDDVASLPVERVRCPHGDVGDRLWVRETWSRLTNNGHRTVFRADGEDPRTGWDDVPAQERPPMVWFPSIHMPRALSRITLEVTSVRVERLQAISEDDARAEGVKPTDAAIVFEGSVIRPDMSNTPIGAFACLWDSINGERAPWRANPWVWVIGFKRIDSVECAA